MTIGYHCEGWDHLILHCLVCRLLGRGENEVALDQVRRDKPLGISQVLGLADDALRKFYYGLNAAAAIVEIDNDGKVDLYHAGKQEDPAHRRHWVHRKAGHKRQQDCRLCGLHDAAAGTIGSLRPEPTFVAPDQWPVVVCVPVEAIEAWLLTAKGIMGDESAWQPDPEMRKAGRGLKQDFYGSELATRDLVTSRALPLLRSLPDVRGLSRYSQSFRLFARQVDHLKRKVLLAAAAHGR